MARIGIDLGGTKLEGIVLDPDGAITQRRRVASPAGYRAKIQAISDLVARLEADSGQAGLPVGVGHPGSLNPKTGLMRNANSTELNGHPLDRDLAESLGRPVRCANDANCFALSEATDGAGAGAASVFGVIAGTGVGGGIVLSGALLAGVSLIAGEWGHTALPWPEPDEMPGPPCKCGKRGCLETWCSGPALAADHARVTGEALTTEAIAEAAHSGSRTARASLMRHHDRLARGLATVINILDPEVIVLGGGVSNIAGIAPALQALLPRYVFSDEVAARVVLNQHGDSSGVRGAAWLWPLATET